MCGIIAVFRSSSCSNLKQIMLTALDRVKHRGPDGSGVCLGVANRLIDGDTNQNASWGLGHVRLAILDLSFAGAQPMSTMDQQYWITYNGEVYNFVELRNELEKSGYKFNGSSDTEVILAAYSKWGTHCLERFNGMFAFVIVDLFKKTAFAARDRLGVKPLYLWNGPDEAVLVSEIKQLLSIPGFTPQIHKQNLLDFLVDGVSGHDPGSCFFEGVKPLKPGHFIEWKLGDLPSSEYSICYWEPKIGEHYENWETVVEEFGDLFRDSVRLRLRSDVPVGTCLSGGTDSSSIATELARQLNEHSLATFSSCSHVPQFDEQYYIDAVNKSCNAVAHKVFPTEEGLINELDKLVYCQDEPFGGPSVYAQYCLMRMARSADVPVLLDGQGGDELLCGYKKYAIFYLWSLVMNRRPLRSLRLLFDLILNGDRKLFDWSTGIRYLPVCIRKHYGNVSGLLRPEWLHLYRTAWNEATDIQSCLKQHQVADILKWSLPVLLRYEDRNSMAHSIETRLPFLDFRLVEYCLSMPEKFFFKFGRTKRVLVDACKTLLPKQIKDRKTKMGFELPDTVWMQGQLGTYLEKRIRASTELNEILDIQLAADAIVAYRNGKSSFDQSILFRIGILSVWIDCFRPRV